MTRHHSDDDEKRCANPYKRHGRPERETCNKTRSKKMALHSRKFHLLEQAELLIDWIEQQGFQYGSSRENGQYIVTWFGFSEKNASRYE